MKRRLEMILLLLMGASRFRDALADDCSVPTFSAARLLSVGAESSFIAVGDFNGDGRPDLAVVNGSWDSRSQNRTNSGVSIFLGKGDGNFENAVKYSAGTNPVFAAVGDFNGDTRPDLAVANYGSSDSRSSTDTNSSISILLGNANGTFQPAPNFATEVSPTHLAIGDFNSDGKPDLAVAAGSAVISVLLGK